MHIQNHMENCINRNIVSSVVFWRRLIHSLLHPCLRLCSDRFSLQQLSGVYVEIQHPCLLGPQMVLFQAVSIHSDDIRKVGFLYAISYTALLKKVFFFLLKWDSPKIKPCQSEQFGGIYSIHSVQQPLLSISEHCHRPQKNPTPIPRSPSISPSPQPLTTTGLLSASMNLPFLHISYKWNHILCDFVCLASLI